MCVKKSCCHPPLLVVVKNDHFLHLHLISKSEGPWTLLRESSLKTHTHTYYLSPATIPHSKLYCQEVDKYLELSDIMVKAGYAGSYQVDFHFLSEV